MCAGLTLKYYASLCVSTRKLKREVGIYLIRLVGTRSVLDATSDEK